MVSFNWAEKYRPKSISEIVGQTKAVKEIVDYIKNFKGKGALLLWGPAGVGKTSSVYAIANDLGYEVFEINASHFRSSAILKEKLKAALVHQSLVKQKRIILFDEVDTFSAADRGGLRLIASLIDKTPYPLIFIANDPWEPKLKVLRAKCKLVEFKRIGKRDAKRRLFYIAKNEGIKVDPKVIDYIVELNYGDLRGCINDLEMLSYGKKHISLEYAKAILSARLHRREIFLALGTLFKTYNIWAAVNALDSTDLDFGLLIQWIAENLPKEYEGEDLAEAFDWLSKADVFLGRVTKSQYFGLEYYAKILAFVGVALAKKKVKRRMTFYSKPSRLDVLVKTKEMRQKLRDLAKRIAKRCHTSSANVIRFYIPMLKIIFKKNKKMAKKLERELNLSEEEVKLLKL